MKIKDLLNQKIDLMPFLFGPIQSVIDLFKRTKNDAYHVGTIYNTKHGQPITIRSEKIMSQYERMYGKLDSDFALNTVKMGLKREICDEIMRSDLFEWSIDETTMGTRVAAKITVNKF